MKVCPINFEPPDNDLCSACHVYPLSRGKWIISILFILNRFIWGLNYIISWISQNLGRFKGTLLACFQGLSALKFGTKMNQNHTHYHFDAFKFHYYHFIALDDQKREEMVERLLQCFQTVMSITLAHFSPRTWSRRAVEACQSSCSQRA